MSAGQDQPNAIAARTRNGGGRFERGLATVERDAEAARLRSQSWTYQQIADHLGMSKGQAYEAVKRALADVVQEPAEELRKLELDRLDQMAQAVREVLERRHVTVSNGKIIRQFAGYELDADGKTMVDAEGKPIPRFEDLLDDAPVLSAVDRLLKIQERRAKLLGLDIPVKQEMSVDLGVEYRIVGVDVGALK